MTYGFKMANSVTDLRVTGTVCAFCVSVHQPLSFFFLSMLVTFNQT